MNKTLSLIILSILLNSCSSKSALEHFNKSNFETRAIQYSKKNDIIKSNGEVELIFWATYLNKVKEKNLKAEEFLISTYFPNTKNQSFEKNNYTLTLNNKNYTLLKEIKNEDNQYKTLTKKNPWGRNYLVQFKKDNSINLILEISNHKEKIKINFNK